MTTTMEAPARGSIIITDEERRNNYYKWQAFQESNWSYFGVPRGAKVRKERLEENNAIRIEWEA
jgi:hypothetical protein